MERMTRMISRENPASSVVEFTRSKKENAQCGVRNAVNVEEEITLQPNARNPVNASTISFEQILPHCQWNRMMTSTT